MNSSENPRNESKKLTERRKFVLAAMLIAFAAALAYSNTLYNDYVFDDVKIIRDNTAIRSFSNVPRIFANMFVYRPLKGQTMKIDPSYRPVRILSYAVDYQFTGASPVGYHISNIIYHIIASILVFVLLRRLTGHYTAALGATLVFVVHPVHTESVAYLTGRKDVLCAIFFLAAFLFFLKYREKPEIRYAVLLPVFFIFAFLAKEMAITLPVVMLLYDFGKWLKEQKPGARGFMKTIFSGASLRIYVPVVLLAAFFSLFALFLKNPGGMKGESVGHWGGSLYTSSLTMLRGLTHYIRLLFAPVGLSADYSYNAFPVSRSFMDPATTLLSLLFLAALVLLGIYLLVRRRFLPGFAVLFFFVSLIPVLQVVPLPERLAERFLYLPSLGLVLLLALALARLAGAGRARKAAAVVSTCLLVGLFFPLTFLRNSDWKDPLTLYSSVIELHPDCVRSRLAVAEEYAIRAGDTMMSAGGILTPSAERDYRDAIYHFSRVLDTLPYETWEGWRRGYALNALSGRGVAYGTVGEYGKALADLERVVQERDVFGEKLSENPQYMQVHFNLGELYYAKQEYAKAVEMYDTCVRMAKSLLQDPDPVQEKSVKDHMAKSFLKKALAMVALNKLQQGLEALLEGIENARDTIHEVSLRYQAGLFQLQLGRDAEAVGSFDGVLELCRKYELLPPETPDPDRQAIVLGIDRARRQAHYMKAEALNRMRKVQDALKEYWLAIDAAPDFVEARFSLGDLYYKLGRLDEAEEQFQLILKTQANHSHALAYLKVVEERKRKRDERRQPRPQKVTLLYEAALRDYETGESGQAQDKLMEALKLASELKETDRPAAPVARVRLLLGRIRYDAGEYDNARTHLQAGLDVLAGIQDKDADFPLGEGNYWLALTLQKLRRQEEAAPHLRKAVPLLRMAAQSASSGIEKAELLVHSARANDSLKEHKEELKDYSDAAEAFPQYPSVHLMAARAALKAQDAAKAFEFFRKSIERKTKVAESYFEMGRLLLERKKPMDAIVSFENALESEPDDYHLAACNYYLGYAYYELEMYAEAAAAWREYLKRAKDPETKKLIEMKLSQDPKLKDE